MSKVMIDVGHGGKDSGAVANGIIEKNLNLKVALLLKDYLSGFDVELGITREKDIDLPSDVRVEMVNNFDPDLSVSIHHNSATTTDARGAEVINEYYDKYDDKLAKMILDNMESIGMPARRSFTKLNSRGSDWYYMIRRIWDKNTEAIIVEGGFITNSEDAKLLKNEDFLKQEAKTIGNGIAEYLALTKKTQPHWGDKEIAALKNKGLIELDHDAAEAVTWAEFATVINRLYDEFKK